MFAWWGRVVVRGRWAVLVAGILFALVGGLWGTGVIPALSAGGFETPDSDSDRAATRIVAELGRQDIDVVVLYSSPSSTVDDASFRDAVTGALTSVAGRAEVAKLVSYYDPNVPAAVKSILVSNDRHATYSVITLTRFRSQEQLNAIKGALVAPGLRTEIGGPAAINADVTNQVGSDIGRAEMYSMPILLILLIFVFRSVIAATTPLLVGGLAILGAFTVTRLITYATEVSIFAINMITLIGLGMAIDYALFVVSRFREELAAGRDVPDAVSRTMLTAGRTVAVSGLTVAIALSSLLLFPQVFLRSMGYGGMAAVLVAMLASLTVLPALLAILGPRVNALRVPLGRRKGVHAAEAVDGQAWARIAHAVMRRPVPVVVGTLLVLGLLASPFLHAQFGGIDERVLPAGTQSRVVAERVKAEFPAGGSDPILVLVSGADSAGVQQLRTRIAGLPRVTAAAVQAQRGGSTLIAVSYDGEPGGPEARAVVGMIRDLPAPSRGSFLVGGAAAASADLLAVLADRLPWMALVAIGATFLLLFLAFGSVLLPVKAVFMNAVSIGASFGAVVWVFQEGHLAGLLGFTSTGYVEASQLVLMLAILFGLSTDYEVFLLSRVREEWDRTGDNTAAVAGGLARTGRIITSAALLLVIVIGGFATGGITFIKMIGVGMIVAITVDATIVRALLVPATMRLMGRVNWWAPGPLARFYRRYGIHESAPESTPELVSAR